MRPVVYLGILGMLFSFILSEFVVPLTNPFAQKVYMLAMYKNPVEQNTTKGFSYYERNSKGEIQRIFFVRKIRDNQLRNVVILDFSDKDLSMIHTARDGFWDSKKGGWVLTNGSSSYIKSKQKNKKIEDGEPEFSNAMHLVTNFRETLIPSSMNPQEIMKEISNVRDMNFLKLRDFILKHEEGRIYTDKLNEYRTKYFNKYSYPISCILLAVIGACLGISGRRRVVNWGYILLGLVVFVFYMSQTVFDSFGQSGRIEPMISVWITNLILAIIAAMTYFYRAAR
jgi:lipopolysaccharide export system permease protein